MTTSLNTQGNETKRVSHEWNNSNRELLRSRGGEPLILLILDMGWYGPIGGSCSKNMLVVSATASKPWRLWILMNPPFFATHPHWTSSLIIPYVPRCARTVTSLPLKEAITLELEQMWLLAPLTLPKQPPMSMFSVFGHDAGKPPHYSTMSCAKKASHSWEDVSHCCCQHLDRQTFGTNYRKA